MPRNGRQLYVKSEQPVRMLVYHVARDYNPISVESLGHFMLLKLTWVYQGSALKGL